MTLGVDLVVAEGVAAAGPPAVATTARIDGFDVTVSGDAVVGSSGLSFRIVRDGEPITPEPYLGADGHLVVLRVGDLAYVHAHAEHDGDDDTSIAFDVDFPTAGTYRLFLDFSVDGVVRTADFTLHVDDGGTVRPEPTHPGTDHTMPASPTPASPTPPAGPTPTSPTHTSPAHGDH